MRWAWSQEFFLVFFDMASHHSWARTGCWAGWAGAGRPWSLARPAEPSQPGSLSGSRAQIFKLASRQGLAHNTSRTQPQRKTKKNSRGAKTDSKKNFSNLK